MQGQQVLAGVPSKAESTTGAMQPTRGRSK